MKRIPGFGFAPYSNRWFAFVLLTVVTLLPVHAESSSGGNFSFGTHSYTQPVLPPKHHQAVSPFSQHQTQQAVPQKKQNPPAPKSAGLHEQHSDSAAKLKTDVTALNGTLDTYIKAGNTADLDLTVVITGIDIVAILNTDLTNIDRDSAVVRDLLGIAKQVPELKDQASILLTALERARPSVKEAQKATSDANARIIPIRNKLNTVDKKIRTVVTAAGALQKGLYVYSDALVKAQQCADGLPQGAKKESIQNNIDQQASDVDPYVTKANTGLLEVIYAVNSIEQSIENDTKQVIEPLHKLESEVDALERKIHALVNPLHDLSALFKKEFSAEFPYPSPTWDDPFRIKHYNFRIGFNVILKGEHAIEHEIEKILSHEMYKAAKVFGLGKLVKSIQHEAMKELNSIKGRLSLNIKTEVPGLDMVKADLDAFEKRLFNIRTPDFNALPVDELLKKVQGEIPKCNLTLSNCLKK